MRGGQDVTYSLGENAKVIVYGANNRGIRVATFLDEMGVVVAGYCDKNSHLLDGKMKFPVYNISQIKKMKNKEQYCIIICLHSLEQHNLVADEINQAGFEKILFLSVSSQYEVNGSRIISKLLNNIFDTLSWDEISKVRIPLYCDIKKEIWTDRGEVVELDNDYVLVKVPGSLIFSNSAEKLLRIEKDRGCAIPDEYRKISDIPIRAMSHFIKLYCYFDGKGNNDYKEQYMRIQGKFMKLVQQQHGVTQDEDIIQYRYSNYCMYMDKYNEGGQYFWDFPVQLVYNEKGYFNIEDGTHRCLFLLYKGYRLFPCSMKKNDYEKWINRERVAECIDIFSKQKYTELRAPVEHPFFYNVKTANKHILWNISNKIENCMGLDFIRNAAFLEIGRFSACFLRDFERIGAKKLYYYAEPQNDINWVSVICRLLKSKEIRILENLEAVLKVDVVLCMEAEDNELKKTLNFLKGKNVKYFFYLEQEKDNNYKEIIRMETSLHNYTKLCHTIVGGIEKEFGVFSRGEE